MSTPVITQTELIDAINAANSAAQANPGAALSPIVLGADIKLTSALPVLDVGGSSLTIESAAGDDFTLSGDDAVRDLAIQSGNVTLASLQLIDGLSAGAAGTGGGGGGAGLGGGLFVGSGATVTLDDVAFSNDKAVGGAGGPGALGQPGGLFGGSGGGGGAGGGFSPAAGTLGRGGNAGVDSPGLTTAAKAGGFGGGGGGGAGGAGGIGGHTIGPTFVPGTQGQPGQSGAKGGFGAGKGGDGARGGGSQGTQGGSGGAGGGGGGGLGAGGDIFVQSGGALLIEGGNLSGGGATGGAGGGAAGSGQGYGSGIFMQGPSAIVFDPGVGRSVVIDDAIADMTGSNDASKQTGVLTLDMNGPGALVLNNSGDTFSGGVHLNQGTLTLEAPNAAGTGNITFGASGGETATLTLAAAAQVIGATFGDKLVDFGAGDSIDLTGLKYTGAGAYSQIAVSSNALSVTEDNETETFNLGAPGQQTFYASSDNSGGTLVSAACYVAGTRILTAHGEMAIEALSPGDLVVTTSGALRPVVWLGHRQIEVARHPSPGHVWPVRVAPGAFGEALPRRELWLSPGHNVACAGVLTPISGLINGRSVAQVEAARVEYWHVELDAHDVIFAEGLPAESYLDTGNRTAFANGGAFVEAHSNFAPRHWAQTCLPVAFDGPSVAATRARLLARLAELGCGLDEEANAFVRVDGLRIEPIRLTPTRLAFVLPAGGQDITLRSKTFVPAHVLAANSDHRQLGLCVGALEIDGAEFALEDDEACAAGWYRAEFGSGRFSHRWTSGVAALPAGARLVILDLAGFGFYWNTSAPARLACLPIDG